MGLTVYLAATAGELSHCASPTFPVAWMACQFSAYSTGLSNLPETLPKGSLVMVNDSTPIGQHDPHKIADQLHDLWQRLQPKGFVLDLQRQNCPKNSALAEFLVQRLPCPVAVSDLYAQNLSCPVFLSVPPLSTPLKVYIEPWKGKEIWLEAVHTQEILTLTPSGCTREESPLTEKPLPYVHEQLHCRYDFSLGKDSVVFTLRRSEQELSDLLFDAEKVGISTAIGLYQQTKNRSTI